MAFRIASSAPAQNYALEARRRTAPFNDPDWLYELKWDGFRALHRRRSLPAGLAQGKHVEELAGAVRYIASLPAEDAILDEVVCLDEHGKADYNALLFRRCSTPSTCSGITAMT